jgi:hypothetical protein
MKEFPVKIFAAVSLLFCSSMLRAQSTQFSGWLFYLHSIKIKTKFSIHLDVQLRSTDELKAMRTIIIRPGLNWQAGKNSVATLGYAFIPNRSAIGNMNGLFAEHRIWQQFVYNHNLLKTRIAHRIRAEERFIPVVAVSNNDLAVTDRIYSTRFRYFFRDIIPFVQKPKFEKGPFAAVQNEIFFNITHKQNVTGKLFDQNRAYIAMGYRLKPSFDIEAGYMNQYVSGRNNNFLNNHIIQVATYLRLN